jgi:chemotaxis protein MotB
MARKRDGKVLVRKVTEAGHGGHHGGAWKVAYADFVTAMMAFFLLMWLLGTTSKAKLEGLAEYFTDPNSISRLPPGGDAGILHGTSVLSPSFMQQQPTLPIEMSPSPAHDESADGELVDRMAQAFGPVEEVAIENMRGDRMGEGIEWTPPFREVEERIRQALSSRADLSELGRQLQVSHTPEGLRIELLDQESLAMFPSGSDQLSSEARRLLEVVVAAVADSPGRLSIRGHTDSRPFASGAGSDNWRLSSDRANATRLALVEMGLARDRVAEVVGKADTEPRLPERPDDPTNRRISMLLMDDAVGARDHALGTAVSKRR